MKARIWIWSIFLPTIQLVKLILVPPKCKILRRYPIGHYYNISITKKGATAIAITILEVIQKQKSPILRYLLWKKYWFSILGVPILFLPRINPDKWKLNIQSTWSAENWQNLHAFSLFNVFFNLSRIVRFSKTQLFPSQLITK